MTKKRRIAEEIINKKTKMIENAHYMGGSANLLVKTGVIIQPQASVLT